MCVPATAVEMFHGLCSRAALHILCSGLALHVLCSGLAIHVLCSRAALHILCSGVALGPVTGGSGMSSAPSLPQPCPPRAHRAPLCMSLVLLCAACSRRFRAEWRGWQHSGDLHLRFLQPVLGQTCGGVQWLRGSLFLVWIRLVLPRVGCMLMGHPWQELWYIGRPLWHLLPWVGPGSLSVSCGACTHTCCMHSSVAFIDRSPSSYGLIFN